MARKRVLLIAMVLSSLLLCFQSFHAFAMATGEKSYLVVLKKESNLDNFIKAKGLEHKTPKKAKNFNIMSVDLTDEELQTLQNDSEIAYIEPDATVEITAFGKINKSPNGSLQHQVIPWGIEDIGVLPALKQKIDGKGIKVAVLDTGIARHPDLKVADGISFVGGPKNYNDDNGHGTHVAGTIVAANNNFGVLGAASRVRVYAVKVLDRYGSGSYGQVIQGIDWAVENGMNIISMSFGGTVESEALHEAIKQAAAKGILVVAAAGNSGAGENTVLYPARYPEVIAVGAVDREHKRADFSSTGPELDIVAPGVDILSTTNDGGYGTLSGTSMATPHVTGAAAALWSNNTTLTAEDIKQKLYNTATFLGTTEQYGHGLVDLDRALGIDSSPVAPPTTEQPPVDQNPPTTDFILEQDKKFQDLDNQLLDLIQRAKGLGNTTLIKKLKCKYDELLQLKAELYKLPEDVENFSKEDALARQWAQNSYYASQADAFANLEKQYIQVISEFQSLIADGETPTETVAGDSTGVQNDVEAKSYDFVGNGQTISPGQSATVSLKLYEPKTAVYIKVLNSSGTVITSTTYYNQPANTPISYTWYTSSSTPVGDYTIQFTYPNNTVVETFTIYVRSSSSNTFYNLYLNTPVDVSLATGAYRLYKFTPPSSGTYSIFTGPYAGTGPSNDTYLELYTDSALTNRIAYDDDSGGNYFSKINKALTGGTTYYIKLRPYSSNIAVYARLTVTAPPQVISLNTPVDVDLPTGAYKVFQFTPSSTGKYNIFTGPYAGTGGSNDTYLELYTDSGLTNKIAYDDDSGGNYFSKINTTLTGGTPYYIKLRPYSSSIAVHARLTVTVDVVSPPQVINLDTPVDVDLPTGAYKTFQFTPSSTRTYVIFTGPYAGTGSSNDTYLELYTDSGLTNRIADDDDSGGNLFSKITTTLTGGTPYYIKLRPYSSSIAVHARLTAAIPDNIPSLDLVGWTPNSITLKAQFPRSGINGNALQIYIPEIGWTNFTGTSNSTADGIYTISGLTPLTTYQCSLIWYTDSTNSWLKRNIDLYVQTPSPNDYIPIQELPQEVINEMINKGYPIHVEGGVSGQWGTSYNNSHATIARQAFTILRNDKGDALYNKISRYINTVVTGASLPDEIESDKALGTISTWVGHFYGPGGTNYTANYPELKLLTPGTDTSPNAYQRFNNHFWKAKDEYRKGNLNTAYTELGMSIHYAADLNAPHHAANMIAYNTVYTFDTKPSWHAEYETWVDQHVNDYLETSAAESYDYVKTNTFKKIADDCSAGARAQIDNANGTRLNGLGNPEFDPKNAGIATEDCFKRAQRVAAGLLYRFLAETGQLA